MNLGSEEHTLAIGTECCGQFFGRVEGELLGCATVFRHHIHVEVAFAVAGKCNLVAIGRPHGVALIGTLRCELNGLSALCGNFKNVALVGKDYFFAIG
ncbi:Uncharacterised protein [Chlamydia trachomatis]|nr:Uncharacterised protein [Chlamydia trachomatis]